MKLNVLEQSKNYQSSTLPQAINCKIIKHIPPVKFPVREEDPSLEEVVGGLAGGPLEPHDQLWSQRAAAKRV